MARYFMHLHECGTVTPDEVGVELWDLDEARERALIAARDVMSHEVKQGALCMACYIIIADADDRELARLTFQDAVHISGL